MLLKESAIFTELFLKLMRKDLSSKLEKANRFAEECNNPNQKRQVKLFASSIFQQLMQLLQGHLDIAN